MGWGIAQVFAAAGYTVGLCDRELSLADKGKAAMSKSLDKLVQREKMTRETADGILKRVLPGELGGAAGCLLVVEAIFEDLGAKRELFRNLEEIVSEKTVLATNTSSLSITEMADGLKHPERVVGMHFFNPANLMKLVEVVSGVHTSDAVMDSVVTMAEEVGKTPVRVNESAGFVVNRILVPMINEAIGVLAEGVATAEDIDAAMKLGANHPMGPLALGDLVGLDVCLAIMEVLQAETGDDKYRPHPLLRKMVRAGWLGRKSRRGFFLY